MREIRGRTDTEASATLVGAFYSSVLHTRELDRAKEYVHPDVFDHHPGTAPGLVGMQGRLADLLTSFPDLSVTVDHAVAQNDRVMVFETWRGHRRDAGNQMQFGAADLYRAADNKIVEHWDVIDYSGLEPFGVPAPDQAQPTAGPDWDAPEQERANLRHALRVWDEVMTRHLLDRADDYFTHDYIQHNQFAAESGAGLAGFKEFFGGLFTMIPDLSGTIVQIVAQGDQVGLFAVWRGHLAETGERLDLHTADLIRIQDGKIAEHWDVFDYTAVARFGVSPPGR